MPTTTRAAQCVVVLSLYLVAAELPARCQVFVPVDRKGALPARSRGKTAYLIVPVENEVWIDSGKGAFRVDRNGNQRVSLLFDKGLLNSVILVGNEVWLGTRQGVFRVDRKGNQAVPVAGYEGSATSVVLVGDEVWFGTRQGAFRVDRKGNQAVPVAGYKGSVTSVVPIGDEVWFGTMDGALRVDRKGNQAVPVAGYKGRVDSIVAVGDEVWFGTWGGAFRVDRKGNQAVPVGPARGRVSSIVPVGDEVWLGTSEGAFRVDRKGNQAMSVRGDTGEVFAIAPVGDEVWLGADKGAFRGDRKGNQTVPFGPAIGRVDSIVPVGDEIWLGGEKGAFRLDRHTKMSVDLDGALPGVKRLLGKVVWLEGNARPIVRYIDRQTGNENYANSQASASLVHASNLKQLRDKEKNASNWTNITQDGPVIELRPLWSTIHFAVRDSWGNELQDETVQGWVIPTWALSVLIPFLSTGFCLVCLALAPYVRYCHMLLMNPFLRNWASFGVVPLLVTAVPPLRRHILRRYCRTLARAARLRVFADRYVVPDERFTSSGFAKRLADHKVIGLHGQSGIGKSAFLTYLAYQCASRKSAHPLLRSWVPVFLDLSVAGEVKPEEMVRTAMRKYGDLTDEKLTDVLLDYGGFLFLFDGLNEVSEPSSDAILQFADMHREHSCSCLTTQVATEGLRKVSTLVAGSLLVDLKIKELVRMRAIDPTTQGQRFDPESLLEKFTVETYKICRVPLQLEMAVEMWEASGRLPKNLDEIYSYVLGPLVDKEAWNEKGHAEWPDVLNALAFTMMIGKRPYDPKKDYLPEELKAELLSKKLLVDRGEVMEFRHDRVRAYLAAKYFVLRWRMILTDENAIVDPNWDAMLEFHLAVEQNKDQARDLAFLVLKKDMDAAIRMVKWGRQNRPELFTDWRDDFEREVGKRVLGRSEKPLSAVSESK